MKTHILQLEPHDDLVSTRDKIGWGQTGRILLVWPPKRRLLTRRLDLLLLQRHCQSLGAQLALVTEDVDVRSHARELQISVFDDARQAQEARWKRPVTPKATRRRSEAETRAYLQIYRPAGQAPSARLAIRLGFFALGLLAVIALVTALFPSATVHLAPKISRQQMTIAVEARTTATQVNLSGVIPLRKLSVLVEGRDGLEPSGQAFAPLSYAQGSVRFTNLTSQAIRIPDGTVVSPLDSDLHFTTIEEASLGRGPGSNASVLVVALSPGSLGNVAAGRIRSILGPLGPNLVVTNPRPLSGGSEIPSPAPTASDREELSERLRSSLQASALAEIRASLAGGDLLLTDPPALIRTLEEVYDPAGEQPANRLDLSLRLEFEALYIAAEDLEFLAGAILDANLPAGVHPLPGSLRLETVDRPVLESPAEVHLELQASRSLLADIPQDQPAYLVAGLTPARARQRLEQYLPVEPPLEIAIQPSWWPLLPLVPLRIEVFRENPGG